MDTLNGEVKFNTCKFRSLDPMKQVIQRCTCQGGNYEVNGFFCNKRQLFDVKPEICLNCELYESK